jgi:two-component system cell cycle response regulator DivK
VGRKKLIKGNRVLLIEDDFINMRLTQYVLEAEGYTVIRAATAREALEKLDSFSPDLILVDIQLPDIDGRVLVRMLRDRPETRDIKILALTACAMKGDREKMLQIGCDGYISKPIDIQDFVKTIRRFAGARGGER